VAQTHLGPVTFLPPIRRTDAAPNTTTMPTTTTEIGPRPAETAVTVPAGASSSHDHSNSVHLPAPPRQASVQRFLTSCVAVAGRACRLAVRYRAELAPAGAVSTLTALGWAQYLAGAGGWAVAGYTALGVVSAAAAGLSLYLGNNRALAASAGLSVALGDVASAVAGGPGAVSLTAAAISTGLAYSAYVPWLVQHRKDQKALPAGAATVVNSAAPAIEEDTTAAAAAWRAANSPFHQDVIPYADDDSDDIADPIRLGWDENGDPVLLKMLYRHTLVAGASDWGKSGIINLIIKKLLRKKHVELFGIDMKPGAMELGPWEPLMKRLARGPEEARDLLQAIRVECDRRGALLEGLSKRSMAAGGEPVRKWIPGVHGPAWFVITDELAELIRQDEELRKEEAAAAKGDPDAAPAEQAVATTYQSLLAIARGFGIQFISATQQPSAKVFGGDTDARGNYTNRISTRVGEAGHTQFIFGTGWKAAGFNPHELKRPGDFYIGSPEMPLTDPPKCRAEYTSDFDIAADVSHLHGSFRAPAPAGRFAPQGQARMFLLKEPVPAKPVGPPAPVYPDGATIPRSEWPDLYRVFCRLCDEQGSATKEQLVEAGPFESRDTVRRALDVWLSHGVQVRKAGRTEQFFLPSSDSDD
jgi:hypothetical protein